MPSTKTKVEQPTMTSKEIRDLSAAQLARTRAKYYPLKLATWALVGISLALLMYGFLAG